MNKKMIASIGVVSFLLFTSLSVVYTQEVKADSEKFYVWVVTDLHFGGSNSEYVGNPSAEEIWYDMVEDSENDWDFDWDIALVLGDLTDDGSVESYWQDFNEAITNETVMTKHIREDFYVIPGNHDNYGGSLDFKDYADPNGNNFSMSGVNSSNRQFAISNISTDEGQYTFQVGNTLFVMFGITLNGIPWYYDYDIDWAEGIFDNTSSDVNLIVSTHHPVEDSGVGNIVGADSNLVEGMETWLSNNNGRVDIWMNGHVHYTEYSGFVFNETTWGTFFLDCAALNGAFYGKQAVESVVLEFTQDSTTVNCYSYYHGYSSSDFSLYSSGEGWDGDNTFRGNHTFELDNAFDYFEDSYTVNINAINNQANNANIKDNNRNLNWTNVSGATKYQLQIANDTDFNDIFYDVNNIGSENYTSEYYCEVGDYINFNITNIYDEGAERFATHYYRIRAYVGT